ncbi:MAG TPA: hypothetical protein DCE14_01745, partial [Kosmotogaceae bacterium]|nr:hypothetical protein [Kosmotogaceae bacterium]
YRRGRTLFCPGDTRGVKLRALQCYAYTPEQRKQGSKQGEDITSLGTDPFFWAKAPGTKNGSVPVNGSIVLQNTV